MKLDYGQLSTIIYSIVYDEAVDSELETIDELIDYLNEQDNSCVELID